MAHRPRTAPCSGAISPPTRARCISCSMGAARRVQRHTVNKSRAELASIGCAALVATNPIAADVTRDFHQSSVRSENPRALQKDLNRYTLRTSSQPVCAYDNLITPSCWVATSIWGVRRTFIESVPMAGLSWSRWSSSRTSFSNASLFTTTSLPRPRAEAKRAPLASSAPRDCGQGASPVAHPTFQQVASARRNA
jgi:hypothetical protein